jgi:hypothetical protein
MKNSSRVESGNACWRPAAASGGAEASQDSHGAP